MLYKMRYIHVRQRTMLIDALRGHLAELGIIAAQARLGLKDLITQFHTEQSSLPELASAAFRRLIDQIGEVVDEIGKSKKEIVAWCRTDARAAASSPSQASGRYPSLAHDAFVSSRLTGEPRHSRVVRHACPSPVDAIAGLSQRNAPTSSRVAITSNQCSSNLRKAGCLDCGVSRERIGWRRVAMDQPASVTVPYWEDLSTTHRRRPAVLIGQLAIRRLALPYPASSAKGEKLDEPDAKYPELNLDLG